MPTQAVRQTGWDRYRCRIRFPKRRVNSPGKRRVAVLERCVGVEGEPRNAQARVVDEQCGPRLSANRLERRGKQLATLRGTRPGRARADQDTQDNDTRERSSHYSDG